MHSQRNTSQALHDGRVLEHLICMEYVIMSAGHFFRAFFFVMACILQFCTCGDGNGLLGQFFS